MTIALFCILIAAIMPIVCAGLSKGGAIGKPRSQGGFDNLDPRGWQAKQDGFRKWANNAQANCWEALPFFGMAIISSHMLGVVGSLVDGLALAFIALRIVYIGLYVTGKQMARSIVWVLALGVNIAIFLLPLAK